MVCSLRNALQDCSGHCLVGDTLDASVLEFQDQHDDVVVVVPEVLVSGVADPVPSLIRVSC